MSVVKDICSQGSSNDVRSAVMNLAISFIALTIMLKSNTLDAHQATEIRVIGYMRSWSSWLRAAEINGATLQPWQLK
jgi:hypothetical protein